MDIKTKEVVARFELPKLMREVRKSLGISQEKLSELSGISRQSINYYENGNAVPTIETMELWIKAIKEIIRSKTK